MKEEKRINLTRLEDEADLVKIQAPDLALTQTQSEVKIQVLEQINHQTDFSH